MKDLIIENKIEIDYDFSGSSNYLIITAPNGKDVINYQVQMLVNNQTNYFLNLRKVQVNKKIQLYYDVGNKATLSQLLKGTKITKSYFLNILSNILKAYEEAEDFQLEIKGIVLDKKYIYMEALEAVPNFVYLPFYKETKNFDSLIDFVISLKEDNLLIPESEKCINSFIMACKDETTTLDELRDVIQGLTTPTAKKPSVSEELEKFKKEADISVEISEVEEKRLQKKYIDPEDAYEDMKNSNNSDNFLKDLDLDMNEFNNFSLEDEESVTPKFLNKKDEPIKEILDDFVASDKESPVDEPIDEVPVKKRLPLPKTKEETKKFLEAMENESQSTAKNSLPHTALSHDIFSKEPDENFSDDEFETEFIDMENEFVKERETDINNYLNEDGHKKHKKPIPTIIDGKKQAHIPEKDIFSEDDEDENFDDYGFIEDPPDKDKPLKSIFGNLNKTKKESKKKTEEKTPKKGFGFGTKEKKEKPVERPIEIPVDISNDSTPAPIPLLNILLVFVAEVAVIIIIIILVSSGVFSQSTSGGGFNIANIGVTAIIILVLEYLIFKRFMSSEKVKEFVSDGDPSHVRPGKEIKNSIPKESPKKTKDKPSAEESPKKEEKKKGVSFFGSKKNAEEENLIKKEAKTSSKKDEKNTTSSSIFGKMGFTGKESAEKENDDPFVNDPFGSRKKAFSEDEDPFSENLNESSKEFFDEKEVKKEVKKEKTKPEKPPFAGESRPHVMEDDDVEDTVYVNNKKLPYLVIEVDGMSQKIYITKPSFIIGRFVGKVDYVCQSNKVGKVHAEIISRDGLFFVNDLNSKNGTYINSYRQRIISNIDYPIDDGDVIILADVEFSFHER